MRDTRIIVTLYLSNFFETFINNLKNKVMLQVKDLTKNSTNVFLDTEFTGLEQNSKLLSIGLVAENGDMFYAVIEENISAVEEPSWVADNVLPQIKNDISEMHPFSKGKYVQVFGSNKEDVAKALEEWLGQFHHVLIWSDVLAYDWMHFCQLFGGAFGIPKNVYYIPIYLSSVMYAKGIHPDTQRERLASMPSRLQPTHHALWDAMVQKEIWRRHLK